MKSASTPAVLPKERRFMTAGEYFRLPAGPPYAQLVEGELILSPSPNFFHQEIIGNLYASLRPFVQKHRLGKIVLSPSDVELTPKNVYQPDLYFVRQERLHLIDQQGLKGAPDLVVEVISRSTARLDRGPKKANFAQAGVVEFWGVIPGSRMVEVWSLPLSASRPMARLKSPEILRSPLFPGWELAVQDVFAA